MIPNKTDKNKLLVRCNCGGKEFVEFTYEGFDEEIWFGAGLWLNFIDTPVSLWHVLRNWWKESRYWHSELQLTPEDVKEIHSKLGQYLEEYEEHNKKLKNSVPMSQG